MPTRTERLLNHTKGFAQKTYRRPPELHEGSNGDIVIANSPNGIKLFAKVNNKWYPFSTDTVAIKESKVVNFSAYQTGGTAGDGTVTAPNLILGPEHSGKTFIVDISEFTSVFRLPPVRHSGANFKFILSHSSNNEVTKDLAIITNSVTTVAGGTTDTNTPEKIVGNIMVEGGVEEISEVATIQINSNTGSKPATYGDWLSFISDGSYWYVSGSIRYDNIDKNSGHVLA